MCTFSALCVAEIQMPLLPQSQQWRKAEPVHRSLSRHRRGLSVRWRPAHGRSGSIQVQFSAAEPALGSRKKVHPLLCSLLAEVKNPTVRKASLVLGQVMACLAPMQALRRSAKPNTRVRAATSFARGGGFGLLASGATQRTMRAGCVFRDARPNPSIERTCPGKPGQASHLKR